MPRKKKDDLTVPVPVAEIRDQQITDTIEKNYMPYAMSVIVSRAIPEIDGFKPSHRKLLYTMYKMGLLNPSAARTKCSNVVGQTMQLNPHGDAAIYDTLVRLTRDNETLLHPFIDSKGAFGKHYSRDNMAPAAPRYTEVKLDPFAGELFGGIDKDAVDMVPNYDNTQTEPVLLPTSFPNILVSPNLGIAVGLASQICSFNLGEICDGTIALLKNPKTSTEKLLDLIKAPDFAGGGNLMYDREQMRQIYETGQGSFKMRAKYRFDKQNSLIEILEIPYSTAVEVIIKRIIDLLKEGKFKEISDIRDEIDLSGFKLTIDIKRGTDPDLLMQKLFQQTTLEDSFSCNFTVLIDGSPKQLGVKDILSEWISFRMTCVRRELTYDLEKKRDKLHLLRGLGKILLDIDKAIRIVRETARESEVVPRLMEGFSIDEIQAEYIAEIRLRHLNREYILDRIKEIESLQKEIADLEAIIADDIKVKELIAKQLAAIKKKYGQPRKTEIITVNDEPVIPFEEGPESFPVYVVLTKEGYFKKITRQSLMRADEQKLKDGDEIVSAEDTDNVSELLFFTDRAQCYKAKTADFDSVKASALGDFVAAKLGFEDGERPVMMKALTEYREDDHFVFLFENGKGVKIPATAYETKTNRKKLTGAYSSASPIAAVIFEPAGTASDVFLRNSADKGILISSALIPEKTTRSSSGVILFNMKAGVRVTEVRTGEDAAKDVFAKCRKNKIPATGVTVPEQLSMG
ncbi:MAG: topoisomerase IV [Ruminococcaceae bacterium]|jgi:DNA gyrase subunit A|nr:topoisomerase IV [Oscillospiraceae bacterium]